MLIVDQFEQVFTLNPGAGGAAERQAFITALHAAAIHPAGPGGVPPGLVVLSVRGDFWDRCAGYPELAGELQEGQFVVGPMTESDLRLAITGPAGAAGLQIEPGLVDTIVSDLRASAGDDTPGALPLLSQAMLLTWENREGDQLTGHGYGQGGGVSLAVQSSAEAVYEALPAGQQELARNLLRSMTVGSRDARLTRRPVSLADLHAGHSEGENAQLDNVLEAFAAKRLVVLNDRTAQISHDALLRAWPRLRGWLEDDQASLILYSQLGHDAAEWQSHDTDPSFLYRGTQLAALREATTQWSAEPGRYPSLTATEASFLRAGEHAATRSTRQRRGLAGVLAVLLIAAIAGAGIATVTAHRASQQRTAAVSGQVAAESEALDTTDPGTASLLAAAAWQIGDTPQARDSMLDVLAQPGRGVLPSGGANTGASVAFSPDGKTLATASGDGMVRLWDVQTRRPIGQPLPGMGPADTVRFSPDGKTLATADADGTTQLWNVASRRQAGTLVAGGPGTGPNAYSGTVGVNQDSAAFSPDGKTLATVAADGTARLWDLATRHQIGVPLRTGRGRVNAVAFSPDGQILATASMNGTIQLWMVASQHRIGAPLVTGHDGIDAVTFSPGGQILATASMNGTIQLWMVATRHQTGAPLVTDSSVGLGASVTFSPDGKTLATSRADGGVQLWDVATHARLGSSLAADTGGVQAMAFSPDSATLATASGDGAARLWDLTTRAPIGTPLNADGVDALAFSPNGKTLATGGLDDGAARLWSLANHAQIAQLHAGSPVAGGVEAVGFSPDGRLLITDGSADVRPVPGQKNTFTVGSNKVWKWDVATRSRIGRPLTIETAGVAVLSPDGKTLATASTNGYELWSAATGRLVAALKGQDAGSFLIATDPVAFSPDSKILATATGSSVQLWNTATHEPIGSLRTTGANGSVAGVAFSPDGKTLVTWGSPGPASLWDVATRTQIGSSLASGTSEVDAAAFSPDGKTLATADLSGTVQLWDVATHAPIGPPLATGTGPVDAVAFSPHGTTLATANVDGKVQLWDVALPSNLLKAVCAVAGRSLTRQEWSTYIQSEPFRRVC